VPVIWGEAREVDTPGPDLDGADTAGTPLPPYAGRRDADALATSLERTQQGPPDRLQRSDAVVLEVGDKMGVEACDHRRVQLTTEPLGSVCERRRAHQVEEIRSERRQVAAHAPRVRQADAIVRVGRKANER